MGLCAGAVTNQKLIWRVTIPVVLTESPRCSSSPSAVTARFVGHLGVVELPAVIAVESILEGFVYRVLFGDDDCDSDGDDYDNNGGGDDYANNSGDGGR
uniref:Uncharacterized protein n=1 Tax=Oryza brachyantha TaxID=4533 RepID=J3MY43_ORYBR